ncbi:MAG: sensor histidine kinase [Chloroflexota bacterium]
MSVEIDPTLVEELERLRAENQKLQLLHNLSKALNQADGFEELAKALLDTLTKQLAIGWAAMGQVMVAEQQITNWVTASKISEDGRWVKEILHRSYTLPLSIEGSKLAKAVLQAKPAADTHDKLGPFLIFPLIWGQRPLGVLVLSASNQINVDDERLLEICEQAATRLGIMQSRLRRAHDTAVEEERNRIAIDMHDTVSQSLFGMIFALDACLKMRPDDPTQIYTELEQIKATAEGVRGEIRQTIHDMWVQMTADRFQRDLRSYLTDVLQAADLEVDFDIRGDFSAVSPEVHRTLYRICQEALTNTVHHAAATDARVCLDVLNERVGLIVRDNGRGFEPLAAMSLRDDEEHFGLRGIQERIQLLGGTCDFFSRPGMGVSLVIDVPVLHKQTANR